MNKNFKSRAMTIESMGDCTCKPTCVCRCNCGIDPFVANVQYSIVFDTPHDTNDNIVNISNFDHGIS